MWQLAVTCTCGCWCHVALVFLGGGLQANTFTAEQYSPRRGERIQGASTRPGGYSQIGSKGLSKTATFARHPSLLCVDWAACCLLLQMLPDQLGFAIVDEVDSILIDESRNPMIISQPRGDNGHMVITVDKVCHVRLPLGSGCCWLLLHRQGVVSIVEQAAHAMMPVACWWLRPAILRS
jgi:hypothetical protein